MHAQLQRRGTRAPGTETPGDAKSEHEAIAESGHVWVLLTDDLSPALTGLKSRVDLLRQRLHRGDDVVRLETDLESIEAELAWLRNTVARFYHRDGGG